MTNNQLVCARELHEHQQDESWCTMDCRFELSNVRAGRRAYDAAHIPGAVFIDLNDDLAAALGPGSGRHPLPAMAAITASFGRLGVSNDTAVVVYDSDNGAIAARTWWTLRWLGHTNVRLLDGGMNAWQQGAYPLSAAAVARQPVEFVSTVRDELVISTAEIRAAARHELELNIFDARDARRFSGEDEPIDAVAGHIPGARCLPFAASLTDDGYWKSVAALRELWQRQLGPDTQKEWVVMCGSGVTACHLALSAVAAGYRDPRLYVGSWSEWITDPGRPVVLGLG